MELTNLSVLRALMEKHGFSAAKGFGQNFIINPGICPKMAEECGCDGIGVIEIGPGVGVLTKELAARAQKVVALEIDRRLIPVLAETLADCSNVAVRNADVLETDLAALIVEEFPGVPVCLCANLPYYITSPILMKLLEEKLPLEQITVMVQKEAAARFCSPPGTRQCGAVSAAVWYHAVPEKLFDVSRGSFFPAPDVDSAVIRLTVNKTPPVEAEEKKLFAVVKAAFAQRRKTLLNSLSAALPLEKSKTLSVLEAAGVPPTARAEQLTLAQLAAIANCL